jgi:hypothetical protein
MKTITYKEAVNLAETYKDKNKATFILFKEEHCEWCNEFIPEVLEKVEPDFSKDIDFYIVPNSNGQLFPQAQTPVSFIFVPGKCPNKMPLIRPGAADIGNVSSDLRRVVDSLHNGLDLNSPRLPI